MHDPLLSCIMPTHNGRGSGQLRLEVFVPLQAEFLSIKGLNKLNFAEAANEAALIGVKIDPVGGAKNFLHDRRRL